MSHLELMIKVDIVLLITPISYFGLEVGDTFTISVDVDGYNPSTAGGLIVKNIQIEKGSSATPYKPYIPSVKMLAEEVNQQKIDTTDLFAQYIQAGKITTNNTGKATVTFPRAFSSAPAVYATSHYSNTGTVFGVQVLSVSATGCVLYNSTWGSSYSSAGQPVAPIQWLAIGT